MSERPDPRLRPGIERVRPAGEERPPMTQRCPVCGFTMPDLRGGTLSVCRNCGYKDDCC